MFLGSGKKFFLLAHQFKSDSSFGRSRLFSDQPYQSRFISGAGPFKTVHSPFSTHPEQWKALLGNLKYIKKSSLGFFTDHVFSDGELEVIARDLPLVIKSLPENKILVLISKYDDIQSVISLEELTTALIWGEKDKINLVFGKIKREIVDKKCRYGFFSLDQHQSDLSGSHFRRDGNFG